MTYLALFFVWFDPNRTTERFETKISRNFSHRTTSSSLHAVDCNKLQVRHRGRRDVNANSIDQRPINSILLVLFAYTPTQPENRDSNRDTNMSAVRTSKVLFNCTSSSYPSGSPVPPVFRRWSFPFLMLTDVHRRDRDASRRVARFIQFHSVQAPRISSLSFFAFLAFDQTLCVLTTPDTLSKHRILSVKLIVPNKWKKTFR